VLAELWERGTLGVEEHDAPESGLDLEAWFDAPFDPPWPEASGWRDDPVYDWTAAWQTGLEPAAIGERLWLYPPGHDHAPPAGRIAVPMFPGGAASGSGLSIPTQLMLEALERHCAPGCVVADIGAGTGILSVAAKALGAERVFACDVDLDAGSVAAGNLATTAHFWCGSARSMASATVDLVLANLNAIQLELLAAELKRIVRPGGLLIAGGFPEWHQLRIEKAFGLPVKTVFAREAWRCLVFPA
jgi:ribosomal protein L11 methyltransferase